MRAAHIGDLDRAVGVIDIEIHRARNGDVILHAQAEVGPGEPVKEPIVLPRIHGVDPQSVGRSGRFDFQGVHRLLCRFRIAALHAFHRVYLHARLIPRANVDMAVRIIQREQRSRADVKRPLELRLESCGTGNGGGQKQREEHQQMSFHTGSIRLDLLKVA